MSDALGGKSSSLGPSVHAGMLDLTKFQFVHFFDVNNNWCIFCIAKMGGGFGLINTGEDCLHLSVHVPVQDEEEGPLAVMVSTIDNVESSQH